MKTITFVLLLMLILSTPFYSLAAEHDTNVKVGILVPLFMEENSPKRVSFEGMFGFNIGIVKYFAVGFETGLNWASWKSYTGKQRESGVVTGFETKETNAFSIPLMINFIIRFDKREEWKVMPYILGGLGYGFTFFIHPDSQETYHGFTWHIMIGVSFRIREIRSLEILVEFGYRGAQYNDANDYELDMSGMVFHAGIRFPFGLDN